MKAKRRQELKTNDLAQAIEEMGKSFREWGVYLVGGVAVVVVAWVVSLYLNSAKAGHTSQAYIDLDDATKAALSPEVRVEADIEHAFQTITELAAQADSESFKLDALIRQADIAMALAESGEKGIDVTYLSKARSAYQDIVDNYSHRDLYCGRALFGLFQIEANEFAVDADPQHRERAAKYLERLRDEKRFSAMPFQTVAVDLLNDLDSVFTPVTFQKAPAVIAAPPAPAPQAPVTGETPAPAADADGTKAPEATPGPEAVPPTGSEPKSEADDEGGASAEPTPNAEPQGTPPS